MILGQERFKAGNGPKAGPTLVDLFAQHVGERPDAIALCDAPNRAAVLGGVAQRLTFGELADKADRLTNALISMGLPTDSVIALHMPLASEAVIATLGVLRAGMIAAPVPLGWGRREIVAHLQKIGARAILTFGRSGPLDTGDLMRHCAAMVFSVRLVAGFGDNLLDGIMPLDALLADPERPLPVISTRQGEPDRHVAMVTAATSAHGHLAVARSHAELRAAGQATAEIWDLAEGSVLASPLALDTFGGLSTVLMPWLISGCRLDLHTPFAARVFQASLADQNVTHCVLPLAASACLLEIEASARPSLRRSLLLARRASDLALSATLPLDKIHGTTVFAAGEAGLLPVVENGSLMLGHGQFRFDKDALESRIGPHGTLLLRGNTVPRHAFPPGAERAGSGVWTADDDGFVDTLYPAKLDHGRIRMTGQPDGVMMVGGRSFSVSDVRAVYAEAGGDIEPVIKNDPLLGQRIAGVIGHGRGMTGLAGRLDMSGITPLAVPGATRFGGQIPFEDTTPPQVIEQTEEQRAHILRQLLAG